MNRPLKGIKNYIDIILELCKVRITVFVAVSTSIGYILQSGSLNFGIVYPSLGVFLLACGSSAINHIQERKTDALMDRTKNRPLPSGRISVTQAVTIAVVMIGLGAALLLIKTNLLSLILGFVTLLWYNVLYTPLKKKYAMAVVPGSLVGALPPIIGWTAAGGSFFHPQVLSLALFFFIWQIPHFWLLLLMFTKDYEKAGFPTLSRVFSDEQLQRLTFIWIAALVTSCFLIPLFGLSAHYITMLLLVSLSLWLLQKTKSILSEYIEKIVFRKAFFNINIYVLVVVLILSIDKLIFQKP